MQITWYGHSAFRIAFNDVVILLDPFISATGLYKGGVAEAQKGATHVLLTHGHDDHVGDALAICKATGARLVSTFEVCMWLMGQGAQNINPGNVGGTVDCGGFTASFTQALHSSSTIVDGKPLYLGVPVGFVIKAKGEPVLYAMGDTDIFGDMALIQEFHAPSVGLVPIGDRFTLGAKSAALACQRYFQFQTIVPCHYATFPMLDQSADAFLEAMGSDRGKVKVPAIGEAFEIAG
jgi:L-ascorbate metabolism protein UlaG (beta-lactamase superfamily)